MAELEVELVATDQLVWSGAATFVSAPAEEGEIGVLAGHTPLLSLLRAGMVRVNPVKGERVEFGVTGGFMSVDFDHVTLVVDSVVDARDLRSVVQS